MKWIEKNLKNEPKSLRLHRQKPFSNYNNYAEKDDLRLALLEEQGYLCCYCMNRIQTPMQNKMKIEHFQSQHQFPELQLDFKNLLASCKGNENSDLKGFHCDKSKSDKFISLNPTDATIMRQIKFGRQGQIFIQNELWQKEIDDILNLNVETLTVQRQSVYKGVTRFLQKEFGGTHPTKAVLNKKIKWWSEKKNGKFEPFCTVAIHFLTKALANAN
jgi:uncharacterized protein (TIGR02646 family)